MSVSPLVGALLGAGVALGVVIVAAAWAGLLTGTGAASNRTRHERRVGRVEWRVVFAAAAAVVVGWWTRWPALAAGAAVAGWVAPSLAGLGARRNTLLARTEAVAVWAEQLRDMIRSSGGLSEAINRSATVAPPAIATEVRALAVWAQRGDLPAALRRFASEVDDTLADSIVTALLIAERRSVKDLAGLLSAATESARDSVALQHSLVAARARVYRTSQLIGIIVAFFTGLLIVVSRDYLAPFGTVTGQIVLVGLLALVGTAVAMMVSLSRPPRTPRLLRVTNEGTAGQ